MSARRFLLIVLATFWLLAAATAGFNYWVDPFQHYRAASYYPARFYPAFQRHQNPGLARHREYDTVVIGSSLFENISASEARQALGGEVINLSLSAMSSYDMRLLAEHVASIGKAKRMLIGIDLVAYSGAIDRVGYGGPPPRWAYNQTLLDDAPYLLSLSTTFNAVEALRGWRFNRFALDADKPWYWASQNMFGAARTVAGLDARDLNRPFKQPPMRPHELVASLHANLLPLLRQNPQITFELVFPPYSILVWADYQQRGALAPALAFKRELIQAAFAYPNVRIHDFQAHREWTHDLALYKDIYHYAPSVTSAMLTAIANGRHRVTTTTFEPVIAQLEQQALQADPASIVAQARRAPPAP